MIVGMTPGLVSLAADCCYIPGMLLHVGGWLQFWLLVRNCRQSDWLARADQLRLELCKIWAVTDPTSRLLQLSNSTISETKDACSWSLLSSFYRACFAYAYYLVTLEVATSNTCCCPLPWLFLSSSGHLHWVWWKCGEGEGQGWSPLVCLQLPGTHRWAQTPRRRPNMQWGPHWTAWGVHKWMGQVYKWIHREGVYRQEQQTSTTQTLYCKWFW